MRGGVPLRLAAPCTLHAVRMPVAFCNHLRSTETLLRGVAIPGLARGLHVQARPVPDSLAPAEGALRLCCVLRAALRAALHAACHVPHASGACCRTSRPTSDCGYWHAAGISAHSRR